MTSGSPKNQECSKFSIITFVLSFICMVISAVVADHCLAVTSGAITFQPTSPFLFSCLRFPLTL